MKVAQVLVLFVFVTVLHLAIGRPREWVLPNDACDYKTLCSMFKIVNSQQVEYFGDYFKKSVSVRVDVYVPNYYPKTEFGKKVFQYRAPALWNQLPNEIKNEDKDKGQRHASIYILGNIHNAAVSDNFSKTQAASDRNESEWNSTEMNNKVANTAASEEYREKSKRDTREGLVIYAGGDASNLAFAYQGSESQSAENDQKSGYNVQNLGLMSAVADDDEYEGHGYDEKKKK